MREDAARASSAGLLGMLRAIHDLVFVPPPAPDGFGQATFSEVFGSIFYWRCPEMVRGCVRACYVDLHCYCRFRHCYAIENYSDLQPLSAVMKVPEPMKNMRVPMLARVVETAQAITVQVTRQFKHQITPRMVQNSKSRQGLALCVHCIPSSITSFVYFSSNLHAHLCTTQRLCHRWISISRVKGTTGAKRTMALLAQDFKKDNGDRSKSGRRAKGRERQDEEDDQVGNTKAGYT